MHTIKLEMGDTVYSHIMFLLKNLNSKELKIIEEPEVKSKKSVSADELETKMFSNHTVNTIEDWKDSTEDEIWK
ncbi:hypothetical protein CVO_08415 [Sulfurimonas sp. CVO]|jgi:hypothetical protein|uniref:Uncharacterized protein n=1 Tax=Sulfurimonas xiamenensis TaxID=2590021 RepID=A0AAJ4A297_9BACT|nr:MULTISPECIES: hypothetical protein [Sulfurimonas]PLY10619.1 MAG: hypothetical protein C0628_09550 [Sulfurimonas sp.]QFR42566.1 hypothetical protein FJR47_01005 [Sulfurimonas xiamenensis]QHG91845.1 hypothetical protein CVO_08415 [Sulfurimonas sp. CVO]